MKPGNNLDSWLGKPNLSKILFLAFLLLLVEHSLINSLILLIVEEYMNHYGIVLALPINFFFLKLNSWQQRKLIRCIDGERIKQVYK